MGVKDGVHLEPLWCTEAGFGSASLDIIQQMLTKATQQELSMALHLSILFGSASAATVSALIRRGADIDSRLSFPIFSALFTSSEALMQAEVPSAYSSGSCLLPREGVRYTSY